MRWPTVGALVAVTMMTLAGTGFRAFFASACLAVAIVLATHEDNQGGGGGKFT